jgi:phage-related minor tail protein
VSETIRELTVQISANGASTAQKDIKGLQNAVAQADAKFKAAGAGIKNFEQTTAGMQARVTMLNDKLKAQQGVVDRAASALEKAKSKMTSAAAEQQKLSQKIDAARAAYNAEAAASGKDSAAAKALEAELQKLEGQYAAQAKSAQNAAQGVQKADIALEQAKATVKGTQAELKAANTTLQQHGTFWAQAGAKIAAAGEKFTAAGKKISGIGRNMTMGVTVPIVAAGTAAFKAWETVDDGLDTVIRKTGATGAALVPLEAAYNNVFLGVKTTAADAGIAVGEVNTRFKATGTQLEDLSKTFIRFADVNEADLNESIGKTSKILAQWQQPASAAGGFLGLLTSESQRTGISVDKLMDSVQTNGATLKGMNLNLSQSVQFMADFEAAGVNADTALAALKKSAVQYTKDGQTLEQGFAMTVKAIQAAKSETEALGIAQKVFGAKGALEMATAIREGRLSVTGLSADMGKMGDVVGKTFAEINGDTANLDKVKNKLIQTGATFGKAMLPWIEQAAAKLGSLVDGFANLDPAIQQNIVGIAGIAAAVGPALSTIGKMAQGAGALMKLFSGPAGWVALAVTALAGLGVAIGAIDAKLKEGFEVKIDVDGKNKITSSMDEGAEAARRTQEIITQVGADADLLNEKIDGALSDKDITGKEFKAISAFINEKVNPDIEDAKKALDVKVAEYKISLDSAVDASGNKYSDEDKDVMLADFEAKNSQLIVDLQTAKQSYIDLLSSIQKQRSPITDAQIAQLNEQMEKITAIRTELRLASDEVVAAGRANYNLTVSGKGNEQSFGSSIGFVQKQTDDAKIKAAADLQSALAAAGANIDDATAAYAANAKQLAAIDSNAQLAYQSLLDGVAKMAGASDTVATINQDYSAFSATLQALSEIKFDKQGGWVEQFKALLGPGGELEKYLSPETKLNVASLLVPENGQYIVPYEKVKTIVSNLNDQIANALHETRQDPKMNPVFTAYQTLLDSGAFENLDTTKIEGALESVIKSNDLVRLVTEQGEDAVNGLSNAITSATPAAVASVNGMFTAMIAEANRMRPLLQNAMGIITGSGGNSPGGGKTGSPTFTSTASMSIGTYVAAGANDRQIILDNMKLQQEAAQRKMTAYGRRPIG